MSESVAVARSRRSRPVVWVGPLATLLCLVPGSLSGQARDLPPSSVVALRTPVRPPAVESAPASVTTVAGAAYDAGAFHRWLFGPHYRELWTTRVNVPVLDLRATAGGLTAVETGGGMQTRSLRFQGADGREYAFRSIDKDPAALLDPVLRGTVVEDLVRDGISAAHPYGALVAAPLLEAAGVLHAEPRLFVMPEDPALGAFEAEFAGTLGYLEERPDENGDVSRAFAGADKVIGSERLTERLEKGPEDRVDARAFLRARLMDVFLGDFDRHRGQWRWASMETDGSRRWQPIPRDRDQVFANFDGVAPAIARGYVPQLLTFGPEYPDMVRLHWNSRAIDRWFLAELDRETWDEVGRSVQSALTDAVIRDAVDHLPREIRALEGDELTRTLLRRRDALPQAWTSLYELMSRQVDVQATDADEVAAVEVGEGWVSVRIQAPGSGDGPYFARRFRRDETDEVRIHLAGGDDRLVVTGSDDSDVRIRVVGGPGNDHFTVDGPRGGVLLYDHEGVNSVEGNAPRIDARPFDAWVWSPEDRDQPREWGSRTMPLFWSSYGSDLGAFLGGGVRHERYGFRQEGFAAGYDLRGGYSPMLNKARVEFDGRLNRSNAPTFLTLRARVSGLDVLHFYGLGNSSAAGSEEYHRVDVSRASAAVGAGTTIGNGFEVSMDLGVERTRTGAAPDRFFESLGSTYGDGAFTTLEVGVRMRLDPLKDRTDVGHRVRLSVEGALYPRALDAESTFGRASAELSALYASSTWPAVALAVRGGAEGVFGRAPWHHAAFVGGEHSVRGWDEQRFAGDAATYAGAELRIRALNPRVIVPTAVGVFGFVDAGRVWLDGASEGGWHTGVGGGLFLQPVRQPYIVKFGAAASAESTKLFLSFGLPY